MAEETGSSPEWIAIAPMRMPLLESYHACLDTVCREGLYLMTSCAPELEKSRLFVRALLEDGMPMYVALTPGLRVIGWCDVYRPSFASQRHMGRLGMGVHPDYREQGIGTLLMERTLKKCLMAGLERVELDVFSSNERAINLYKKFGFEVEGVKRRARKTASAFEDIVVMGKLMTVPAAMAY